MMKIKTCAMIRLSSMRTRKLVPLVNNFKLPANPNPPPEEEATHHNETFVKADKLDLIKIFEDVNHPAIPDMTPTPFTGGREEFDVAITEEEINNIEDSNGTI